MKISNIKLRLAGFLSLASFTLSFPSCSFFNSFDESPTSNVIEINSLSLARTALETQIGAMEYVSVSVKPSKEQKNITLKWDYDASIIECDKSSNWGVTIKGLAEGQSFCLYSTNLLKNIQHEVDPIGSTFAFGIDLHPLLLYNTI